MIRQKKQQCACWRYKREEPANAVDELPSSHDHSQAVRCTADTAELLAKIAYP